MLRKLESANYRLNRRLCLYISGWGLMLIMALLILDAGLRTFFARPIWGMMDIIEIILVWIVFAAFAYALITGHHVRMTLVVDRLPPRVRPKFEIFGSLIGVAFFGTFTYLACIYFWESFLAKEVPMSPIPSPVWLGKASLPVGGLFILFSFVFRLIRSLRPTREVVEEAEKIKGF